MGAAVRAMDRTGTGRVGLQDLMDHLAPRPAPAAADPAAAAAHKPPQQQQRGAFRSGDAAVVMLRGDLDPLFAETVSAGTQQTTRLRAARAAQ
jgi:hypothetical protein